MRGNGSLRMPKRKREKNCGQAKSQELWELPNASAPRHDLDTASVVERGDVLLGYSFARPWLSRRGVKIGGAGSKASHVHEWVVRLEGHSLAMIGVAMSNVDRTRDMQEQPGIWVMAAYWGDLTESGQITQGFAPSLQVEQLPAEMHVRVVSHGESGDCTLAILREGRVQGGTVCIPLPRVADAAPGSRENRSGKIAAADARLHLAVGSCDHRCKFTIVRSRSTPA